MPEAHTTAGPSPVPRDEVGTFIPDPPPKVLVKTRWGVVEVRTLLSGCQGGSQRNTRMSTAYSKKRTGKMSKKNTKKSIFGIEAIVKPAKISKNVHFGFQSDPWLALRSSTGKKKQQKVLSLTDRPAPYQQGGVPHLNPGFSPSVDLPPLGNHQST